MELESSAHAALASTVNAASPSDAEANTEPSSSFWMPLLLSWLSTALSSFSLSAWAPHARVLFSGCLTGLCFVFGIAIPLIRARFKHLRTEPKAAAAAATFQQKEERILASSSSGSSTSLVSSS